MTTFIVNNGTQRDSVVTAASKDDVISLGSTIAGDYMYDRTNKFLPRLTELNGKLKESINELTKNATDPAKLAQYQTAASAYNVYRQMVSSSIKDLKDQNLAIIRNF